MILTRHAVTRFQSRHVPHLTEVESRELLATMVVDAELLPEKTLLGQAQWLIDQPGERPLILVTKDDPHAGGTVCVTVLDHASGPTAEELEELYAAAARDDSARRGVRPPATPPASCTAPPSPPKLTGRQRVAEDQRAAAARREERRIRHEAMLLEHARAKTAKVPSVRGGTLNPEREAQRAANPQELTRIREHAERMNANALEARKALRIALRVIAPRIDADPDARAAWETIGAIQPGWLSDAFLGPKGGGDALG